MPPLESYRRLQTKKKPMKEKIPLRITKKGSFCYHSEDDAADDVFNLFQNDHLHEVMLFVLQKTIQDGFIALVSDSTLTYLG